MSDAVPGEQHESIDPSRHLFDVIATGTAHPAEVGRSYEFGVLATAAQLIGGGQRLLDMSVEYAKQRRQFGRLIGSYQAIKHKLADVHIALEMARPLLYRAALALADNSPDVPRDVSAAKVAASDAALLAARSALQTHGAIGFTAEHDLSLWLSESAGPAFGVGRSTKPPAPRFEGTVATTPEDRDLLRSTVAALIDKHASPAKVREAMASDRGYDEALWSLLCEQVGVTALLVPEEFGGAGGELADAAAVLEELGRALVPTPLLGTTLAQVALLASDEPDLPALEGLAAGTLIGTVFFDPDYVVNGDIADVAIAATDGSLTRWSAARAETVDTMDPTRRLARLLPATQRPSRPIPDWPIPLRSTGRRTGRRRHALSGTHHRLQGRVQFGRPIGSFQALKHRLADLYVSVQSARAVVWDAIATPSSTSAALARLAATEAFCSVAAEAIQMHGGIAITWEHDIQLYFKRAHGSSQLLGPTENSCASWSPRSSDRLTGASRWARTARSERRCPEFPRARELGANRLDESVVPAEVDLGPIRQIDSVERQHSRCAPVRPSVKPSSYQTSIVALGSWASSSSCRSRSGWVRSPRSACGIWTWVSGCLARNEFQYSDHRGDADARRDQSQRLAVGRRGQITERHGDIEDVAHAHILRNPFGHLADRLDRKHQSLRPGALTRLYCRSCRAPSGIVTPTETYRPEEIPEWCTGRLHSEQHRARRIVDARHHAGAAIHVTVRNPGTHVEIVFEVDQCLRHDPVHAVPRRGDLIGDGLGAQHGDDRGEQVLVDDRILVGRHAQRGVLVPDTRQQFCRMRQIRVDEMRCEGRDRRGEGALLRSLRLIAAVEQIADQLRVVGEHSPVELGRDLVDPRADQRKRRGDDLGVGWVEFGPRCGCGSHQDVLSSVV